MESIISAVLIAVIISTAINLMVYKWFENIMKKYIENIETIIDEYKRVVLEAIEMINNKH